MQKSSVRYVKMKIILITIMLAVLAIGCELPDPNSKPVRNGKIIEVSVSNRCKYNIDSRHHICWLLCVTSGGGGTTTSMISEYKCANLEETYAK